LVDKFNGKQQFDFQPVILEYVRYQAGDQSEAHQKAIDYYHSIAKQPPWKTKDDVKEYLEIFDHFYQLQDYNFAFESIWICDDFLTLRGYYADLVELYGQLVSKWEEIGDKENWNYRAAVTSLGNAYDSLGQYQRAIEFHQQSLEIKREIGDSPEERLRQRNGEGKSLGNLDNAYNSLRQYQRAIEFYQQSLEIKREIGDIRGEAIAWFNLGLSLKNVNRQSDALGAYRNARELYQAMGLDAKVQDCNNAIERLSQPKTPVVSRRGFWGWLCRLWRWVRSWFRR